MRQRAYEIRKKDGGYAVFELGIADGRVSSECKISEYDFLTIAISKLAAHLQLICPEMKNFKNPLPTKDEALSDKDETVVDVNK